MSITLTNWETVTLLVLIAWELAWKGMALWRAAKLHQPYWFASLLVFNTAGILPIVYLYMTATSHAREVRHA